MSAKLLKAAPQNGADKERSRATDADKLLRSFDGKLQLIRDRVESVVHRYHTGCYITGRAGTGKSQTVRDELERLDVPWVSQNARMTPMGLFRFLAEHPEHVAVLDDIVTLFKSDQAVQILLAALDGDPGKPRVITYRSQDVDEVVTFTGAIVAISNVPLRSDPLARALGSRVVVLEHEPTDDELAAFIRKLAQKGFKELSAEECADTAEFVISETRAFDLRLDLRHFSKALQDRRQFQNGKAKTDWRNLVRSSLRKPLEAAHPLSKREEIERDRQAVLSAIAKHPGNTAAQLKASGLKKSTFYERRKEVTA